MKTFKIKDNCGRRFNVRANSRSEARAKAQKMTTATVVYILD
jgi:hypothetical protein